MRRSTIDCPVSRCPKTPRHSRVLKRPTVNLEGGGRLRLPALRKWRAFGTVFEAESVLDSAQGRFLNPSHGFSGLSNDLSWRATKSTVTFLKGVQLLEGSRLEEGQRPGPGRRGGRPRSASRAAEPKRRLVHLTYFKRPRGGVIHPVLRFQPRSSRPR